MLHLLRSKLATHGPYLLRLLPSGPDLVRGRPAAVILFYPHTDGDATAQSYFWAVLTVTGGKRTLRSLPSMSSLVSVIT